MTFKEYIYEVEKDFKKNFRVSNKTTPIVMEGYERMKGETIKWKLMEKAYDIIGKDKDLIFEISQKHLENELYAKITIEYINEEISSEIVLKGLTELLDTKFTSMDG